ncbi:carboxypeptidase A4 [Cryptococcus gattii NT-10]|nr:carboxypeptidase A4 [Cryptococcus gattii NT-10]
MRTSPHACALLLCAASAIAAHPRQAPIQLPLSTSSLSLEIFGPVQRYDDDQVWRVKLAGEDIRRIEEIVDLAEDLELDIWRTTPGSLDIRLNELQKNDLKTRLHPDTLFEAFITNVQSLVDFTTPSDYPNLIDSSLGVDASQPLRNREPLQISRNQRTPKVDPFNLTTLATPFHDSYHTLKDIHKFGDVLVETFNGKEGIEVWGFDVGTTWEGRPIKGWSARLVKNESDPSNGQRRRQGRVLDEDEELRKEIVIISGQHGREWVGPSSALYFLHSLLLTSLSSPSSDAALMLSKFTFTVIPTINPDGFVYSQSHRMWRKNRQPVGHKSCVGIDLNSNWAYKWKKEKKEKPCKEGYRGKAAFEAYETKAVGEWLAKGAERGTRVRAFIDLHSYGQLFMFPFAHSCSEFPVDAEMLMEAGLGVAKAIRTAHGETYETGQACDLTYRAPGDSVDYAYGVTDVRWSYSAELRDTGTYGFMLPKTLIRPTAEEISAGILHLAKFIYVLEIAD